MTMTLDKYITALREGIRFETQKGLMNLEQLWFIPLRSRDNFNLEAVAQAAHAHLKEYETTTFVKPAGACRDHKAMLAELRLDLIKHVIEVKLEEERMAAARLAASQRRSKLLDALERKQDAALEDMTEDEIKQELAELSR